MGFDLIGPSGWVAEMNVVPGILVVVVPVAMAVSGYVLVVALYRLHRRIKIARALREWRMTQDAGRTADLFKTMGQERGGK